MADTDRIRLYIDEDVWAGLAATLRDRGYDAINAQEEQRKQFTDEEQLTFAALNQRALLTYNKKHFIPLAIEWWHEGRTHYGIVVSTQLEQGELLRRVLNLLERETANNIANQVIALETYK
jgi:predicted nuclease of predicted toxin-antitoxin system